jgi:hypothetical protein
LKIKNYKQKILITQFLLIKPFVGETRTETSSTSSTSLSSRVLPDVDENSLDASQNVRDESEFEVDTQVYNDKSAIFTFEEPFVRCIPNEHV